MEPTYRSYKAEQTKEVDRIGIGLLTAEVDYTSLEIPAGIRHYFNLNERSQLFLNAQVVFDFQMNAAIEYTRESGSSIPDLEIANSVGFGLGMGYKFDRIHFEARYASARDILNNITQWKAATHRFPSLLAIPCSSHLLFFGKAS